MALQVPLAPDEADPPVCPAGGGVVPEGVGVAGSVAGVGVACPLGGVGVGGVVGGVVGSLVGVVALDHRNTGPRTHHTNGHNSQSCNRLGQWV